MEVDAEDPAARASTFFAWSPLFLIIPLSRLSRLSILFFCPSSAHPGIIVLLLSTFLFSPFLIFSFILFNLSLPAHVNFSTEIFLLNEYISFKFDYSSSSLVLVICIRFWNFSQWGGLFLCWAIVFGFFPNEAGSFCVGPWHILYPCCRVISWAVCFLGSPFLHIFLICSWLFALELYSCF